MDDIDAAVWSGDLFYDSENRQRFREMMERWERGLKAAEEVISLEDTVD